MENSNRRGPRAHRLAGALRLALVGGCVAGAAAMLPWSAVQAQEEAPSADEAKSLDVISVLGSRKQPRSEANSPVPVDIISGEEFHNQGLTDVLDQIRTVVPSLNVNLQPISDAATLVRPANLRGLPPDSTLVLVNGKRRHRSAVITFLGSGLADGSQGPDLSVFPSIALSQVEVLRDGAAAQYGSDAIAGVINFNLKSDREGGSLEVMSGQHYEGDGTTAQAACPSRRRVSPTSASSTARPIRPAAASSAVMPRRSPPAATRSCRTRRRSGAAPR
jgi:iron complex outermembrane receptor protein